VRTALVGTKQLGLDALSVLRSYSDVASIVTIDDRDDGRTRFDDLVAVGARVVASRQEADTAIRGIEADIILVVGWYWIIGSDLLSKTRFLGIHHSLLPAYRGGSPLVWALIKGEKTVGTTIFELTEGADEGPIWAQERVAVHDGYIGDVAARCDTAALRLLPGIFRPTAAGIEQDHKRATWVPQRRPEHGLIDWSRSAVQIQRWIRAQSRPYPGAFTYSGIQKVTIWRATASTEPPASPRAVVAGGIVACGDGNGLLVEDSSHELADGTLLSDHPLPSVK
jgi:methionyl-tRNA formyltransferase